VAWFSPVGIGFHDKNVFTVGSRDELCDSRAEYAVVPQIYVGGGMIFTG
jgi:hypothetical protein